MVRCLVVSVRHGAKRRGITNRGVTLVELLIVIVIISILAGAILGVASVAGETARASKTRNTISRIHTLLMEHMAAYKARRIPLSPAVEDAIAKAQVSPNYRGMALQEARLYALRELMLTEMPDRWSDVWLASLDRPMGMPFYTNPDPDPNDSVPPPSFGRTEIAAIYLRKLQSMLNLESINSLTSQRNTVEEIINNQSAECLYLLVMNFTGDGESRSYFGVSDIGDVDGDGAKEFLDGWGHPINFLRWAPGFDSPIQHSPSKFTNATQWQAAADLDHDPYDVFRVDHLAFRLVPLIYSPGRNGDSGLISREDYVPWPLASNMALSLANNAIPAIRSPILNTHKPVTPGVFLGGDNGEGTAADNIHNHLLGLR